MAIEDTNIDIDPALQYGQYAGAGSPPSLAPPPVPGSVTISTINGLSGPTLDFSGGSTGLTFSPGGTTITLSGTLAIANGGTGAASAADARASLAVASTVLAGVAPTAAADGATGFPAGTQWIDLVLKDAYISVDDSAGAAVWKKTTP